MNDLIRKIWKWIKEVKIFIADISLSCVIIPLISIFLLDSVDRPIIQLKNITSWEFIILIVSILILSHIKFNSKRGSNDLKKENEELKRKLGIIPEVTREVFLCQLYSIAFKLGFGTKKRNTERISLYIHDSDTESFILCARYSANPEFSGRGRPTYGDNQGCIAEGWKNGEYFDDNFSSTKEKYIKYTLDTYNMDIETVEKLSMRSRLYGVIRIEKDNKYLGVLVVESTIKSRFKKNELLDEMREYKQILSDTIYSLKEYIPNPQNVKERGF